MQSLSKIFIQVNLPREALKIRTYYRGFLTCIAQRGKKVKSFAAPGGRELKLLKLCVLMGDDVAPICVWLSCFLPSGVLIFGRGQAGQVKVLRLLSGKASCNSMLVVHCFVE